MEKEIWKDIPGFEGYQVSNLGRVKSMDRWVTRFDGGRNHIKERILYQNHINSGYLTVQLGRKGGRHLVHRLVWEAFNGPIPEDIQVNHINEDKTDNRLVNLNLMTRSQNTGCASRVIKRRMHPCQYDLHGNLIKEWNSLNEINRELGYSQGNISMCCNGIWPTSYGFIWRYKEKTG